MDTFKLLLTWVCFSFILYVGLPAYLHLGDASKPMVMAVMINFVLALLITYLYIMKTYKGPK